MPQMHKLDTEWITNELSKDTNMSAATNDVTGDSLVSKKNSDAFRDNWEVIFGKKKAPATVDNDVLLVDVAIEPPFVVTGIACSVCHGSGRNVEGKLCPCGCKDLKGPPNITTGL